MPERNPPKIYRPATWNQRVFRLRIVICFLIRSLREYCFIYWFLWFRSGEKRGRGGRQGVCRTFNKYLWDLKKCSFCKSSRNFKFQHLIRAIQIQISFPNQTSFYRCIDVFPLLEPPSNGIYIYSRSSNNNNHNHNRKKKNTQTTNYTNFN